MSDLAGRPFDKYERYGPYHWREIQRNPFRHNAVLTARYQMLLRTMDSRAQRILDVGCGDGTLTFRVAARGARVWGIDDAQLPLQLALAEFARHPVADPPRLLRADARGLPFLDASFDCVILADVIEHIDAPEAVIEEVHRVLQPGGQLLITTPRRKENAPVNEYHCHEFTARELEKLLDRWFDDARVEMFQPLSVSRLYQRRVFGRKVFRVAINCCSILGWNPLASRSGSSDDDRYTDLCGSCRKT
jgi:ubiquinone/menaquinone biosynthesis C-methylase UbiE